MTFQSTVRIGAATVAAVLIVGLAWGAGDRPPPAEPQSARVTITVQDAAGRPLPGAGVRFGAERGGRLRSITIDSAGHAVVPLACDDHRIEASFPGLVTLVLRDVPACGLRDDVLVVTLDEACPERVVLRCPGPPVVPEKTTVSTTFRAEFLAGLPGSAGSDIARQDRPCRKRVRRWRPAE